jgi:hypothetical protein
MADFVFVHGGMVITGVAAWIPEKIGEIPKTYILCTKSDFVSVTGVARKRIEADPEGWEYFELPASHVPMADMPGEFYGLLLEIPEAAEG